MKRFKVAAISSNRNSFGLFGVVLIANDGTAYRVASNDHNLPKKDGVLEVPTHPGFGFDWAKFGFEIPEALPKTPPEVVKQVWG